MASGDAERPRSPHFLDTSLSLINTIRRRVNVMDFAPTNGSDRHLNFDAALGCGKMEGVNE
jgi:hypothetical protein